MLTFCLAVSRFFRIFVGRKTGGCGHQSKPNYSYIKLNKDMNKTVNQVLRILGYIISFVLTINKKKAEDKDRKSNEKDQKSEDKEQRSEDKDQRTEDKDQRSDD